MDTDGELQNFGFPEPLEKLIRESWRLKIPDLIYRFDLLVDSENRIKLIECNADTPTVLMETGKAQKIWADQLSKKQFNRIELNLTESWNNLLGRESANHQKIDIFGVYSQV